jgi:hypothetical protein
MTTFTTEDRINASPPHIVDSGASVMKMTANELADKLMSSLTMEYDCDKYMEQAATMLRQQHAEISLLQEYVCQLEKGLDSSINLNKAQALRKAQEK